MTRHHRHAIVAPVHVRTAGDADLELTETVDLSEGGVCILTARDRRAGETLELRLMLPCRPAGMRMRAVVVWTAAPRGTEERRRCGVRLLAMDLRDALLLRRYLAQQPSDLALRASA